MALYAEHISVSFPGVKALDDAYLKLEPNRVHALLGANGSGKSTMVKVLTGIYHPNKNCGSRIIINGQETADILNPTEAQHMGIRVVHQETPLIGSFTVSECVTLFKGYPKNKVGGIAW
jgi:ABC-type sugar transport system ATPase subunit